MTAHLMVPALDADRPRHLLVALSSRAMLKQGLGFGGVVFSDDMGMKAATGDIGLPEASVAAIQAGCDAVLLCNSTVDEQWAAIEALIHACERQDIPQTRVDDAFARQRRMKERFATSTTSASPMTLVGAAARSGGYARPTRSWRGNGGVGMSPVTRCGLARFRPVAGKPCRVGGAGESVLTRGLRRGRSANSSAWNSCPSMTTASSSRAGHRGGTGGRAARHRCGRAGIGRTSPRILAVRGGYGSVETLPLLASWIPSGDARAPRSSATAT